MKQELIDSLLTVKSVIEAYEVSDAHKILGGRIQKEIDSLARAYEVDGMKAAELKGYYRGLHFYFDVISAFKREGEVAKTNYDALQFRKQRSSEEPK